MDQHRLRFKRRCRPGLRPMEWLEEDYGTMQVCPLAFSEERKGGADASDIENNSVPYSQYVDALEAVFGSG